MRPRHSPRRRRRVRPVTLRAARVLGFRYDPARDAWVLRLVGNRFGPVLKSREWAVTTERARDSAAEALEWSGEIEQAAARRRTGRFRRKPRAAERDSRQDVLRR